MTQLHEGLAGLDPARLRGARRGIEREGLRALPDGTLALTPHPAALGSPLAHPHITTDFSESQLELITGVHAGVDACLAELTEVHQFAARALADAGGERIWASSMPCILPGDDAIPLARYGSSNVAHAKSVYRMGLGYRYGRRMQTISGLHYNWSLPGVDSEGYFALIRNFRRHAFLMLYLFGASPALCSSFLAGRPHALQPLGGSHTLHMPHGTSLRMGPLGYQSDAQSTLSVSYNDLDGYAASLQDALTRPWPAYEAIGVRGPDGGYRQLATTLLQIENEFYGVIRPKRVIFPGERPLHALRERGVEYVEVRLMDLDPFEPLGISAQTIRFLDVFLLHCLLSDSPPDSPEEIARLKRNQHRTAASGREPGLLLERGGRKIALVDWAAEIIAECADVARVLDTAHGSGGTPYADAVQAALQALRDPSRLPAARVLAEMAQLHGDSFTGFAGAQSQRMREYLLALPWTAQQQARQERLAEASFAEQARIEAGDTMPFEQYRAQYVSPARLDMPATPDGALWAV